MCRNGKDVVILRTAHGVCLLLWCTWNFFSARGRLGGASRDISKLTEDTGYASAGLASLREFLDHLAVTNDWHFAA